MTPEEQRRLNAEVATRIFGLTVRTVQDGDPEFLAESGLRMEEWEPVLHYFTRIEAAWRIVTHYQPRLWLFDLNYEDDGETPAEWRAEFTGDMSSCTYEGRGKTAMEAICRAGLEVAKTTLGGR